MTLIEQAESLGISVDKRWSEETLREKIKAAGGEVQPEPDPMFPVRLVRNYRPMGNYEVIGHDKQAVVVKDSTGKMVELEPAEFVEGEAKPPVYAGTGFDTKVWKDTFIKLPLEEARTVIAKGIGARADAIGA